MYIFFTFCISHLLHRAFCPTAHIVHPRRTHPFYPVAHIVSPHLAGTKKVPHLAARNFLPNYFFLFFVCYPID